MGVNVTLEGDIKVSVSLQLREVSREIGKVVLAEFFGRMSLLLLYTHSLEKVLTVENNEQLFA